MTHLFRQCRDTDFRQDGHLALVVVLLKYRIIHYSLCRYKGEGKDVVAHAWRAGQPEDIMAPPNIVGGGRSKKSYKSENNKYVIIYARR